MRQSCRPFVLAALLSFFGNAAAVPMDFDFSGTFTNDNDVVLLDFTVSVDSTVTIFSSSWLSGDSGLGFDPILAIWDASGDIVNEQDDGNNTGSTLSNGVLYNHGTWDSYFSVFLAAGDYTASITQFDNFREGDNLSAGFRYDGNADFTFDEGYGPAPLFNGVWSSTDERTGDWEFHILNVDAASGPSPSVPEPATVTLVAIGLAGLGYNRKRKANKVTR